MYSIHFSQGSVNMGSVLLHSSSRFWILEMCSPPCNDPPNEHRSVILENLFRVVVLVACVPFYHILFPSTQ